MSKTVGIILVNYQDYASRFLNACRDSLRAQDYPVDLTRIYIVDNAATPASEFYLKENYPEARILTRPDGNYAAANNLGFARAISDGCEYLVTLNLDTELRPEWLTELVKALTANPQVGIAQSKILLYPRTEAEKINPKINSLGNLIHFLGFGLTAGYGETDREIAGYPEIKGYASGCSFIMRATVFQKIGGYNEEFYMYHDDVELSLKTRLAGHKIILAPRSVVYHKYEFSRSTKMLYYMERNRFLTAFYFYPLSLLLIVAVPCLIMSVGLLFFALLNGWLATDLKVYAYFGHFKNYIKIQTERRKIKKLSVVPFIDVARDFVGKIEFQEIANPLLRYVVNPLFDWYWRAVKKIV